MSLELHLCLYEQGNVKISKLFSADKNGQKQIVAWFLNHIKMALFGKLLFPIHSSYIVGHGTSYM